MASFLLVPSKLPQSQLQADIVNLALSHGSLYLFLGLSHCKQMEGWERDTETKGWKTP